MNSFVRLSLAIFLVFISQYMLFPVLPVVLADELEISIASAGKISLILTAGMILGGPFYNYLIDTYKRKRLCVLSFSVILLIFVGYYFLNKPVELFVLPLLQGVFLGILISSLLTIGIDIIPSEKRDSGNLVLGWMSRLGMISGVALGSLIYLNYSFQTVVVVAIGIGIIALLFLTSIRVSFRAPIGVSILSLDRFFFQAVGSYLLI
ncbi:MAG: MFS transporter [Bacteroides sp.]|nr:MFS transporter [Bacteroides sp.]